MKALAITLCLLLVGTQAGAQQSAARPAPSFYVPYAVSLAAPSDLPDGSSSSEDARVIDEAPLPSAPQPQHYPVGRGYHRSGPPFIPNPAPLISPRSQAIVGAVIIGIVLLALVGGDR